jgi:sulfur-carrier protein adenylyltransferase/sulfurtransferase
MGMKKDQYSRYARHLMVPDIGVGGQEKLLQARVLMIGAGGLGSAISLYLAAAGVGTIGVVDFDTVDASNLQRQVLFDTQQIGLPKAEMAAKRLGALNKDVTIVPYVEALTSDNALQMFADYDYIVDATDNFATRYLINDAAVLSGKLNIYGSVFRFDGQATIFGAKDGPCYRCMFPVPPPESLVASCSEGGVLGVLPGLIGLVQATETVKLITGIGEPLIGRLLTLDALSMLWREMKVKRDLECPVCGANRALYGLIDYMEFCGINKEETAVPQFDGAELRQRLANGWDSVFLDLREPHERQGRELDGAVQIPIAHLIERLSDIEAFANRNIVVCCETGAMSLAGARILRKRGFAGVVALTDGVGSWLATEAATV